MSSREQKRAALHQKLMLLRDATNSSAMNKTSIIVDASKYIEELKQKVENLNQEIGTSEVSRVQNSLPVVTVETLEKGFLINVYSEKNCPGLLVSILEAFEELDLDVLDARVSCTDSFQLEAVGGDDVPQYKGYILLINYGCILPKSIVKNLYLGKLFHLNIQGNAEGIDAQVVKEAVLQAIKNVQESEE